MLQFCSWIVWQFSMNGVISNWNCLEFHVYKHDCSLFVRNELPHDKTNKMTSVPSEASDQPGHPPSLIRVFAVSMKKHWALNYLLSAQRRLWSDWVDAQADLSLRWVHMSICWFCHAAAQVLTLFIIIVQIHLFLMQNWIKEQRK